MNTFEHLVMFWIITISLIIFTSFTVSTLINYIKNKQIAALYLSLNYIFFMVGLVFIQVGHYDSFISGVTTDLYSHASMIAKVFIVAGILANILFHAKFVQVNNMWKNFRIIAGIVLMVWILLPFNYTIGPTTGMQMKYVTYLFMAIYGLSINFGLSYSFFKLARKVKERRKELISLGLGAFAFLLYYILMTIYGMTQNFTLMIATMIDLFFAFLFYFIGIYLPKLKHE
jgi:hypothetical protein